MGIPRRGVGIISGFPGKDGGEGHPEILRINYICGCARVVADYGLGYRFVALFAPAVGYLCVDALSSNAAIVSAGVAVVAVFSCVDALSSNAAIVSAGVAVVAVFSCVDALPSNAAIVSAGVAVVAVYRCVDTITGLRVAGVDGAGVAVVAVFRLTGAGLGVALVAIRTLSGCSGQGVSQVFVRSRINEEDVSSCGNRCRRRDNRTGNSYQPVLASWYGGVYTYGDDADWLGRCRCLGSISGNNCRRQVNVRLAGVVPTGAARRGVAIGEDNDEVGVQ
ncbi:hypothetical protein ES708_05417 [subsurface metagenome]